MTYVIMKIIFHTRFFVSLALCIKKFSFKAERPLSPRPIHSHCTGEQTKDRKEQCSQQEVIKIQVRLIPKPEFPTITAPTEGWAGVLAALGHPGKTDHQVQLGSLQRLRSHGRSGDACAVQRRRPLRATRRRRWWRRALGAPARVLSRRRRLAAAGLVARRARPWRSRGSCSRSRSTTGS